jgi:hypothetical protein
MPTGKGSLCRTVKGLVPFAPSDTPTTDEKRVAAKGTHQRARRLRRSMLGSTGAWMAGEA